MCQESDSSRQARGELGLCSRGTEAEEATDSHSSISASIREMMGKHINAGEGKNDRLPKASKMSTFSGGVKTLSVFLKAVVWAVNYRHTVI